jgi:hypothetical protein
MEVLTFIGVAATQTAMDVGATVGMAASAMATPAGLALGGAALAAAGQIGQAQAASAQAKGQEAIAQYNARVDKQNAEAATQQSLYRQQIQVNEADRLQSSLLAQAGAGGVVPTEGTPLMIQAKQAAQSELDRAMIAYQGQIASRRYMSQSAIDTAQAGIYGQQASNYSTAGYIGAGSTLLTGLGKYYS